MATKIVTKNSSTASAAPTASDLVQGELAVNVTDKRLYTENASGDIVELGTNPSTIDINAGTIDGAVIGGATPAAITGTAITATGIMTATGTSVFASLDISGDIDVDGTTNLDVVDIDGAVDMASTLAVAGVVTANAGIALPDSQKATFGASDDLEIYHDGSDSYITDSGDGSLYLRGSNQVRIESATGEKYFIANVNSDTNLYYDNAAKLATTATGIDVTGEVTADGITNNGDVVFSKSATGVPIIKMSGFAAANNPYGIINFYNEDGSQQGPNNAVQIKALAKNSDGSGGELAFHTSTGTSSEGADADERMRIDSSGRVGIGASSPSARLDVYDGASASTEDLLVVRDYLGGGADKTRLIVKNGGNVGIGTSSPTGLLSVSNTTYLSNAATTGSKVTLNSENTSTWTGTRELVSLESVGNGADHRIGSFSLKVKASAAATSLQEYMYVNGASNYTTFSTGGTERMRIDSSGNLLVGYTAADGIGGAPSDNNFSELGKGYINLNRDDTATARQVQFGKNGVVAGYIQTDGSTTSYVTSSDQRLKENITDADDAGSKIDAIQVRKYDWKADGTHQDYGMIAQELQTVAPEAVSGDADSEEMMGVDYSKLVPMLVKEIQSLRNRVAQLEG